MSFILDALRKSENERQRGTVPDVARIPLAQPAPRTPRWTMAVIALLSACVVVFAAAWWQSQRSEFAPRSAAVPAQPTSRRTAAPGDPAPPVAAPVPVIAAQSPTAPTRSTAREPQAQPSDVAERPAPATPAVREPVRAIASPAPAENNDPPPSVAQLRASGIDVPTLDLQLHSFSDSRAGRFVFINGARYAEGDTLAAGPRVVRITPNGVVLDQLGRQFVLNVD
jgi:general secretion pathway protein B